MNNKNRFEGIYNRTEVYTENEYKKYMFIQIKSLLEYAFRFSNYNKIRFEKNSFDIQSFINLSDLKKISVIRYNDLIHIQSQGPRLGEMTTKDLYKFDEIFLSPGPIFNPKDKEFSWGFEYALYANGIRKDDIVQNTINSNLSPSGAMFKEGLEKLFCTHIPTGPIDPQTQFEIMRKLKTTSLITLPSFLIELVKYADDNNIKLHNDLKSLEVISLACEKISENLRVKLEQKFNALIRQIYLTTDIGVIGYECFYKKGFHINPNIYVEICHPDTGMPVPYGEIGEIVITTLNKSFPLIRYGTGDLSYIDDSPCECGRTGLKLAGILGRIDNVTKINEELIYPYQFDNVIKNFKEIYRWQIEVSNKEGIDDVILKLETDGIKDIEIIIDLIYNTFKFNPKIELIKKGSLPMGIKPIIDKRNHVNS